MAGKWMATSALLILGASPVPAPRLGVTFPAGFPAVDRWEKVTGELEVASPHTLVQYEFFVSPARQALYEVVRYRVTPLGPEGRSSAVTEKVQWHRGLRDLIRYECVPPAKGGPPASAPGGRAGGDGCVWEQLPHGTPRYDEETRTLMWLYGLHRKVVLERESSR